MLQHCYDSKDESSSFPHSELSLPTTWVTEYPWYSFHHSDSRCVFTLKIDLDQKFSQMSIDQNWISSPYGTSFVLLKEMSFSNNVMLHQFRCVQLPFRKVEIRSSLLYSNVNNYWIICFPGLTTKPNLGHLTHGHDTLPTGESSNCSHILPLFYSELTVSFTWCFFLLLF